MKRIKHCCCTQRCGDCRVDMCLCVFWNCKKKSRNSCKITIHHRVTSWLMRFGSKQHTWRTCSHSTMRQTSGCRGLNPVLASAKTPWTLLSKLDYRLEKMSNGGVQHFPLLLKQSAGTLRASLRAEFTRHLNLLREEIKSYFADIGEYIKKEAWVLDPYISTLKDVEYLGCEDELCDLQADSLSKKLFQENGYKKFWIVKGQTVASRLAKYAVTRVTLPFSTTCLRQHSVPLWR